LCPRPISNEMKLSFYGSAQEITGSCFLLEDGKNKILIDCGLFQCPKFCDARSREAFPFDPKDVDALFVTHAHVDHTGRIPKLIREGFRGKIYSTHPTRDLTKLMLGDSLGMLEREARLDNEPMLYTAADVERALELWEGKDYHEKVMVGNFAVTLYDAAHVLGSAMILITHGDPSTSLKASKILFASDLGNADNDLLGRSEVVEDVNYMIIESTYGDREHEDVKGRQLKLERVIERSVGRKGVLMIPAFSIERTQQLLLEMSDMLKKTQIPEVPIFLDSPLAIKATKIYQKYYASHIAQDGKNKDSFSFFDIPSVRFTLTTEESKRINSVPPPKVIIAGSGMSVGGRILHHERRYLSDPNSTLLLVSYQAPGSLGRRIQDGAGFAEIFGKKVPVRCFVETIHGYSAHPDASGLFEFVRSHSNNLKKVFVVHGEPKSSLAFVQKLRDYLGIDATSPKYGESVEL